jgi:glutamine amidotransferase
VTFEREGALTAGLGDAAAFYHVHTYACRPHDAADVVGRGEYGERFVSIVERGNVMGAQFHPEKSSLDGLALLRNFVGVRVHA